MKFGLDQNTVDKINSFFGQIIQIQKVIIYGSRAKGNFKPGSDIDLTFINSKLDLTSLNKIRSGLDDLNLPYTFDLSVFEEIQSAELIEHIDRVGQVFYLRS